jgi:hypothetical protein
MANLINKQKTNPIRAIPVLNYNDINVVKKVITGLDTCQAQQRLPSSFTISSEEINGVKQPLTYTAFPRHHVISVATTNNRITRVLKIINNKRVSIY